MFGHSSCNVLGEEMCYNCVASPPHLLLGNFFNVMYLYSVVSNCTAQIKARTRKCYENKKGLLMYMKWPCLQRLSDHFGAPSLLRILYLSAQILRRISCLLAKHGMILPQEFSITSLKSCAKLIAPHVATHKLGEFRNTHLQFYPSPDMQKA